MAEPWIDLTGQIALVTGAAAGIGRATAMGLAELGATVVSLDRDGANVALDLTGTAPGQTDVDHQRDPQHGISAGNERPLRKYERVDLLESGVHL